mmetsp:Transcript_37961/g.83568  ORF Transcript_37961/g.83568 Transcript_37961/m.83568 type:complete len:209 (-) Transcript_37961:252-878(-)
MAHPPSSFPNRRQHPHGHLLRPRQTHTRSPRAQGLPTTRPRHPRRRAHPLVTRRPVHASHDPLPTHRAVRPLRRVEHRRSSLARGPTHRLGRPHPPLPTAGRSRSRVRVQPERAWRCQGRLGGRRPDGGRHRHQHRRHALALVRRQALLQPAPRAHANARRVQAAKVEILDRLFHASRQGSHDRVRNQRANHRRRLHSAPHPEQLLAI